MRMFLIFDLPTKTAEDRRKYTDFRNSITKDGFIMIQYSVYCRFCRNDTEYYKMLRRIKGYVSAVEGEVRVFAVTEKQYSKMNTFSSKKKQEEILLSANPLVVIE